MKLFPNSAGLMATRADIAAEHTAALATLDFDKVIAALPAAIAAAMKAALATHGLKMPQLAPALRVLVCGRAQTPSIDAVLALFSRDRVLERLASV